MGGIDEIKKNLEAFKSRFYKRQALIGFALFLILLLSTFLLINSLEYSFWLASSIRSSLFFGFLTFNAVSFYLLVMKPLLKLFHVKQGMSDDQAAVAIAEHFPEISDKLRDRKSVV